jgi:hypothetical protein
MKLLIEMEAVDWLDLLALHKDVMEVITSNMANDPIAYSSAARLTNEIFNQVWKKIPTSELDRIIAERKNHPTPGKQ